MVSVKSFRKLALQFEGTVEAPHFEKSSFRVNKKIFATLSEKNALVCVKLNLIDQSVFCLIDAAMIAPVPNKWGRQGWTNINLHNVTAPILADILRTAYEEVSKSSSKK